MSRRTKKHKSKINILSEELIERIVECDKILENTFDIPLEKDTSSYNTAITTDEEIPKGHNIYTIETTNKGKQEDVIKSTFSIIDNEISSKSVT